jgi:hypothetical protein
VINAFANYFKHRDEWNPVDWSDPKGLNTNTLKVITAIGATPASDRNLQTATSALSSPLPYQNLGRIERAMLDWGNAKRNIASASLGVLTVMLHSWSISQWRNHR